MVKRSRLLLVGATLVLVALIAVACNGSQGDTSASTPTSTPLPTDTAGATASPTPIPTMVPIIGTATPAPASTATAPPAPSEPSDFDFVYREFGPTSDAIWRVDLANLDDRQKLTDIDHAAECATFPSLSPDGGSIAYTVLTAGTCSPGAPAQAFVLPIGGSPQLVAEGVVLQVRPRWSPDGGFIYLVRRGEPGVELIRVDIDNGEEETLFSTDGLNLTPIGFRAAAGKTLYYAQIGADGSTSIASYDTSSGQASVLMQISEGIARDYALSPDGGSIIHITEGRAFIADLASGALRLVESDLLAGVAQFKPIWKPDGSVTIGQLPVGGRPSSAVVIDLATGSGSSLTPPDSGFDVPLSWAPDGKFLALRSFEGTSEADPGRMRLVLLNSDGKRLIISENLDIVLVGWI